MKQQKCLAFLAALCLTLTVLTGCQPSGKTPASNQPDPGSSSATTPVAPAPEDPSEPLVSEPESDPSQPEEPENPGGSNPDSNSPGGQEPPFEDKEDNVDKYPDTKPDDKPSGITGDWTQPDVPMTTVAPERLAALAAKWNSLKLTAYTETFGASVPGALMSAASPKTVRMMAAMENGEPTLDTQAGRTGWNLSAGGALILNLDKAAAQELAGKRVAVLIDYYAPKSAASLQLAYADGNQTIKPAVARKWTRDVVLVDAAFSGGAQGPDLRLAVTAESAIVSGVHLLALDSEISEVDDVFLVTPKYGKERNVITAVADVQQFGAVGDGKVDDTAAFQAALDYAGGLGGGMVYVPEGHYAIADQLVLPANVALIGELDMEALDQTGKVTGTILDLYYGKNDPDGEGAIVLGNGSSLQYLAFWYPEQQIVDGKAVPYSYTITGSYVTGGVSYGVDIENIMLVNAYNGMKFGPKFNVLQTIRNVYGTPLNNGFFMDANADLARVQGMYFSPKYWAESGLPNAPEKDWIFNCTFRNATAYIAERVDWTYVFDVAIDGYQTGILFRFSSSSLGNGASNGSLYNLDIYDCYYGIDIAYMNEIGIEITSSRIYASGEGESSAIRVHSGLASTLTLMDCELGARGKHVIYSYREDALSLSNCTLSFLENTPHGAAIYSYQGAVSATQVKFRHVITGFYLGKLVPSARLLKRTKPSKCSPRRNRTCSRRPIINPPATRWWI